MSATSSVGRDAVFGMSLEHRIRVFAGPLLLRQRLVLPEIETVQCSLINSVVKSGFGASHDTGDVGLGQTVSVPAHPTFLPGGIAHDQRVIRNIPGNCRAGSNKGVAANRDAANKSRVGPDGRPPTDKGLFVQGMPVDLGSRVTNVREHAGGSEEDVIFNDDPGVNGNIVLNFYVAANYRSAVDIDILPENAV